MKTDNYEKVRHALIVLLDSETDRLGAATWGIIENDEEVVFYEDRIKFNKQMISKLQDEIIEHKMKSQDNALESLMLKRTALRENYSNCNGMIDVLFNRKYIQAIRKKIKEIKQQ